MYRFETHGFEIHDLVVEPAWLQTMSVNSVDNNAHHENVFRSFQFCLLGDVNHLTHSNEEVLKHIMFQQTNKLPAMKFRGLESKCLLNIDECRRNKYNMLSA